MRESRKGTQFQSRRRPSPLHQAVRLALTYIYYILHNSFLLTNMIDLDHKPRSASKPARMTHAMVSRSCRRPRISSYLKTGSTCSRHRRFQSTIIRIPKADVYRFGDTNKQSPVFKDLDWTVKDGENWAVTGPAGIGKSDILEVRMLP